MYRTFPKLQLTSLFWYRRAADTIGRLKSLQAVDAVWLGGAPTAVNQPYWQAADMVVPSDPGTSFLCTLEYRWAADTVGFKWSTMLGRNCASADILSSTADSLTPLVQVGSLYLHSRIRKIYGLAVHALRFPSEFIAEIIRCAAFLNIDAGQVALCVDTREI